MSEIVKTCKKHGNLKLSDLKTGIYKGIKYRKCKKCEKDRSAEYRKRIYSDEKLHSKEKQKDKEYWKNNKEKIKQRRVKNNDPAKRRKQYKKLAPRYREHCRIKQKEYRENLTDTYMRKIIQNGDKNIPLMSIPIEMLKLKRAIMMAKKSIRNLSEINLKERLKK